MTTPSIQRIAWGARFARNGLISLAVLAGFVLSSHVDAQSAGLLPMPTLQDERNAYTAFGWTFTSGDEPNFTAEPGFTYADPDVHNDTEGDDLWSYLQGYRRTGQLGYRDRMLALARYFKDDFNQCAGTPAFTLCADEADFYLDHFYGWGLIDYYLLTGSSAHLTAAINLGIRLESFWYKHPSCNCKPTPGIFDVVGTGHRRIGRHLVFAARLAEVTQAARWINLRDYLVDLTLQSQDWNATYGFYTLGQFTTDFVVTCQANAYANGARVTASWQMATMVEGLYQVWRTTGNPTVRNRIVAIAAFVKQWGLHPSFNYTGSYHGIILVGGTPTAWFRSTDTSGNCNRTAGATWDPNYTTSYVNTLVYGYKFTGDASYLTAAKRFFGCGNRNSYGTGTPCNLSATDVNHFVDSQKTSDNCCLAHNDGELQYTYRLFENGGSPTIEGGSPPAAPTNLQVQ